MNEDDDWSIIQSNWHSSAQKIYPLVTTLIIEDEKYNRETHTILQVNTEVTLQSSFITSPPQTYSPHHLLLEDKKNLSNIRRRRFNHLHINQDDLHYYNQLKHFSRLLGDVPIEYNKKTLIRNSSQLDKTSIPSSCPRRYTIDEIKNTVLLENEYFLTKEDYNTVIRDLNYNPKRIKPRKHQYKHVYISHEIRYFPKDRRSPPSDILTPKIDFIDINNTEVLGTTIRGTRRRYLPTTPHQGILKRYNNKGQRDEYWKTRFVRNNINSINHREIGATVRFRLYNELLKDQSRQFTDWYTTTKTIVRDTTDLRFRYTYYINRKFRHHLIEESERLQQIHTEAAEKIIIAFRTWQNRRYTR